MNGTIDMPFAVADDAPEIDYMSLTANIVAAYLSNNHVQATHLPALITSIHAALTNHDETIQKPAQDVVKLTPAQIRRSIKPDALISFVDGKPYKTLKRHLTKHGLTIEMYRERYGLPRDYPSTAASYSAQRSELARTLSLGRRNRQPTPKLSLVTKTNSEPSEPVEANQEGTKSPKGRRPKKIAAE